MNWLNVDKKLWELYKAAPTDQHFIEASMSEMDWTKDQTIINTLHLIERFRNFKENFNDK